jgi:hypothetical protein
MRLLILSIILLSNVFVYGQSEEQLLKYKELYEKGLIDSVEYKALKNKELGFSAEPKSKVMSDSSLSKLLSDAKAQRNSGTVFTGLGALGLVGTVIYWNKGIPTLNLSPNSTSQQAEEALIRYNSALKQYKANRTAFATFSIIFISLGLFAFTLSETKFILYKSNKLAFNFGLQDSGIGLTLNF